MATNQGYSYRHVLCGDAAKHSVVSYLASHFSHSTVQQWTDRVLAGEILLDGKLANGSESIQPGQTLVWNRPSWTEEAAPKNYEIIYQDQHVLAVNKPSGLPTIPGGGFYQNTLLSLVRIDFPAAKPLHRLGRATSGLVLFALSSSVAAKLTSQWPNIQKQYQALAAGRPTLDSYDICAPIGKVEHPLLGTVHAANELGKPAKSVASVLERRSDSTVLEVDLHSGRPHQIRIHLAFIGHPLVGDPLYASGGKPILNQPGLPGDAGYHLHAKKLLFKHPITSEFVELTATLPEILRC